MFDKSGAMDTWLKDMANKTKIDSLPSLLLYGIHCVNLYKSSISKLEKTQAMLIKTALGIRNSCHNTPLLKALRISSVKKSIDISCLLLLKSSICIVPLDVTWMSINFGHIKY